MNQKTGEQIKIIQVTQGCHHQYVGRGIEECFGIVHFLSPTWKGDLIVKK